jgi:hypothetical protein
MQDDNFGIMRDRKIHGISESVSRIRGKIGSIEYFSDFWNHCWPPSLIKMAFNLPNTCPTGFLAYCVPTRLADGKLNKIGSL